MGRERSALLDSKRKCLIYCTEETGDPTALHDAQSWKTLLRAAQIRQYQPILDLVHKLKDDDIPVIYYHRKCSSIFTMKKDLDMIGFVKLPRAGTSCNPESLINQERRSGRGTHGTTYEDVCIFCSKGGNMQKENKREKN